MKTEAERQEIISVITPMCEAFGIKDFDYILNPDNHTERLKLNNALIGCSDNSISAIIDEIIGYLFVTRFTRNRSIGAFEKQTLNAVKQNWIKEATE